MLVRRLVRRPPFPRAKHGIAEKSGTPYLLEKFPNSNIIPVARVPNGNVAAACCLKDGPLPVRAPAALAKRNLIATAD